MNHQWPLMASDFIIYLYVHNDVALYILHFLKSYTSLLANVVCC